VRSEPTRVKAGVLDAHVSIRQAGELLGAKKLSRFAFNGKFVKRRFCPEK